MAKTLLSINNYYYYRGGAESIFLQHNHMFEQAGWEVVPFAMDMPQNLPSKWQNYFSRAIEWGTQPWWKKVLDAKEIIYSSEAKQKLQQLLEKVKPDIAHVHNIYHHLSPSILEVLKEAGVPVVMTLHDLKLLCPNYQMLNQIGICEECKGGNLLPLIQHRCMKDSLALSSLIYLESSLHRQWDIYRQNVDKFIVPSQFYRQKFIEWDWDENILQHIPNFVDTDRYNEPVMAGKEFVYVGRVSPEKSLDTLVRAAAKANVMVNIVGQGSELKELQALAFSLQAKIRFSGYLRGEALINAIANARAVVLPSEWYENAPVSVLEAYALGKPVIGSRIGGIPELIKEGETGALFEMANVDQLADILKEYTSASDKEIVRQGEAAREFVKCYFDQRFYMQRVLDLYQEFL